MTTLASTIIKNGRVIDGTGNPWFKASIAIKDGKISKISAIPIPGGDTTIDATGFVVAPGFIDSHTHSDNSVMTNPRCENHIRQGVTTNVTGSCGSGEYHVEELRNAIEKKGTAVNFAHMVGMNKIREHLYGSERTRWELILSLIHI